MIFNSHRMPLKPPSQHCNDVRHRKAFEPQTSSDVREEGARLRTIGARTARKQELTYGGKPLRFGGGVQ